VQSRRDYEEKQLADLLATYQSEGIVVYGQIEGLPGTYAKILVKSDGTVKVEGITTISGSVDISDRWTRQLGQIDIERYLGSAIGVANPLHSQIVVSGAVVDPRSIRSLVSTDVVTAYGSQTQALLQRATTYDLLVAIRQAGSELSVSNPLFAGIVDVLGNRLPSMDVSTRPGYVDEIDRAARLLGVVYGSQGQQLLQRATTYDLIVQLRSAGIEIDPRSIRALVKTTDELYSVLRTDAGVAYDARQIRSLISTDVITAYGSQTQALLQRATTYDLIVQLRSGGVEIDPRSIRALVSSDVVTVYGSQTQALLQRATTYDSLVQLRHAGTEIDPRITTDVTKVVSPSYLAPTSLAAAGTATIVAAPGVGYKLRLKRLQVSVNATTRIDFLWGTSAFESYFLPANGSVVINKIGENFEGAENTALTLLSSAAATVTASASTETLAA